jgi:lipoprotein-releasing system permease protein
MTAKNLRNNSSGIFLGGGIAEKMSLQEGDCIQISTVNGQIFPLKIAGVFQSGITFLIHF